MTNRHAYILIIILISCGIISAVASKRLYTTGYDDNFAIEVSSDSFKIARPGYDNDVMIPRLYATCKIKHIADSFYSIRSSRDAGFRGAEIKIENDSTLNGRTRVIIYAFNLPDHFYISRYAHWTYPVIEQKIQNGVWVQDFLPTTSKYAAEPTNFFEGIVIRPQCDYIRTHHFYSQYLCLLENKFLLPTPVDLRTGNQCVTITFPHLDDYAFSTFYLNEIIIMTDSYLKWNYKTYYRSHIKNLSEWIDSLPESQL